MKTKAQIVGELLKDGKINAEDAVVLLQDAEIKYVYINTPYYVPTYLQPPYVVTCGTGVVGTTFTTASAYSTLTNN